MKLENIIERPLITEKAARGQQNNNEYYFRVNPKANKHQIREAVEKFFKVKVASIHTMNVHPKQKRVGKNIGVDSEWKKAIITLHGKETIKVFEGQ